MPKKRLKECPDSPNCVCSQSQSEQHFIEPIDISHFKANVIETLQATLTSMPRARLVNASDNYLHYEFRSRFFQFVDDVEFLVFKDKLHVRSASRTGYSDFGVNRRRIETIRKLLSQKPH